MPKDRFSPLPDDEEVLDEEEKGHMVELGVHTPSPDVVELMNAATVDSLGHRREVDLLTKDLYATRQLLHRYKLLYSFSTLFLVVCALMLFLGIVEIDELRRSLAASPDCEGFAGGGNGTAASSSSTAGRLVQLQR